MSAGLHSNMSTVIENNPSSRDSRALNCLQNTLQSHAMGVPALLFQIMLSEIRKQMLKKGREDYFTQWHEPSATRRVVRPDNPKMEMLMSNVMNELSHTRGPEFDRRRDLLFQVSKRAIVTKWTTDDGRLKKHVSAVLWLLARIMVQDTWGVDDLEDSPYELLDPTAEMELDIGSEAPTTDEEVRRREVDFLHAGKLMHQFWDRATRDYVQRYREPLSLEKAELHRFVHVMRNVQTLVYQYPSPSEGWVWSAPGEFWDACYTIAVLRHDRCQSSRALVAAVLSRYDAVWSRVAAYHDKKVGGEFLADSQLWAETKVMAATLAAKTRETQFKDDLKRQRQEANRGGKRKARAVPALHPPYQPKRARQEVVVGGSAVASGVVAAVEGERHPRPLVPTVPISFVEPFLNGDPMGPEWGENTPLLGVNAEESRNFTTHFWEVWKPENVWAVARSRFADVGSSDSENDWE